MRRERLVRLKNEASAGKKFLGKSFLSVRFEEGAGVFEITLLALAAFGLEAAEGLEGLVELAREALAVGGRAWRWCGWCRL